MFLSDPLEGVKLCQGHIVYHLTMFIGHFAVDTTLTSAKEIDPEHKRMYEFFLISAWLHLAAAILQLL